MQGVHYGVVPGMVSSQGHLLSVWNVLRPHNWWVRAGGHRDTEE